MTARAHVDYDKLVAAYWANLTTVLRGFTPGEDLSFLEAWVLDDDAGRSLLNLMEAARDYQVESLTVDLSGATTAALDGTDFLSQARALGAVDLQPTPQGATLSASFKASHAAP